jgi:hypothetical protein
MPTPNVVFYNSGEQILPGDIFVRSTANLEGNPNYINFFSVTRVTKKRVYYVSWNITDNKPVLYYYETYENHEYMTRWYNLYLRKGKKKQGNLSGFARFVRGLDVVLS